MCLYHNSSSSTMAPQGFLFSRGSYASRLFRFHAPTCILATWYASACVAFPSSLELSNVYRDIAERSNRLPRWPDSKKFCDDCLVYDDETKSYNLPTFDDGHGSLGIFSFLDRSNEARSIMKVCDNVFDQFCSEISNKILTLDSEQRSAMQRWILQAPSHSHHISVAILQEHPCFLRDEKDLEKWKPIGEDTIDHLAATLARELPKSISQCPPILQLDSLVFTPDGALIAGFIDSSPDQSFQILRQVSREIAQDVLGDVLTTRPKNLIHATIGRIVGLPPNASDKQYQMLTELAMEYNQVRLPRIVDSVREETSSGGVFNLQELSLARNIVWMLKEYKEYASWMVQ